jgi:hypothetical protein
MIHENPIVWMGWGQDALIQFVSGQKLVPFHGLFSFIFSRKSLQESLVRSQKFGGLLLKVLLG